MTDQDIVKLLGNPRVALVDEKCLQCGVVLDVKILSGLCPTCLLKQGLIGPLTQGTETFGAPSLESIAEAMRGLFEPVRFIGRGGMGAVYEGRHSSLNRTVALKVMLPPAAESGSITHSYHRFKREGRLPARLSHRNIVAVYDFGLGGNFLYFTMDFVDGPSLGQMLKSGPLIPSHAFELFLQLCDGLRHAHESRVIHRDIKPENLLVDKRGVLKIADFGLAKLNGGGASDEWPTEDGRGMGTLYYMAPEQFEEPQAVDHRADIYSAGVVLYEMLTGGRPLGRFSAPSQKAEVDPSLDAVLFRALEK